MEYSLTNFKKLRNEKGLVLILILMEYSLTMKENGTVPSDEES